MSRILPIAMGMVLCAFAGASATTPEAPTTATTIVLDRAVHFTAPDGSDLTVAAGTYRVEQAMSDQIRLIADPPQPPIEIQATSIAHDESLPAPVSLSVIEEGQDDQVHVVFLLPNGQGLDATGSFSGTRSRATFSPTLNSTQVQYAVSQFKVTQQSVPVVRVPPAAMPAPWKAPIYRVLANGDLLEAAPSAPSQPVRVGNGWQSFKHVVAGAGTVIYAIQPDGVLFWYSHFGAQNATMQWADRKIVGRDWQHFRRVFASNDGVIYAITPAGVLKWYKHLGVATGENQWAGPVDLGTGWQKFGQVFSGCNGVIYAVTGDGKLLWYKHSENPGTPNWQGPKAVGTGWQEFRALSSSCGGKIYALKKDGSLLEYHHLGWQAGIGLETPGAWAGPTTVATGWTDSRTLFASHTTYPPPPDAGPVTAGPPFGSEFSKPATLLNLHFKLVGKFDWRLGANPQEGGQDVGTLELYLAEYVTYSSVRFIGFANPGPTGDPVDPGFSISISKRPQVQYTFSCTLEAAAPSSTLQVSGGPSRQIFTLLPGKHTYDFTYTPQELETPIFQIRMTESLRNVTRSSWWRFYGCTVYEANR